MSSSVFVLGYKQGNLDSVIRPVVTYLSYALYNDKIHSHQWTFERLQTLHRWRTTKKNALSDESKMAVNDLLAKFPWFQKDFCAAIDKLKKLKPTYFSCIIISRIVKTFHQNL